MNERLGLGRSVLSLMDGLDGWVGCFKGLDEIAWS